MPLANICGVDPGKQKGGFVLYGPDSSIIKAGIINKDSIQNVMDALSESDVLLIERAQASAQMGVTGAFEYGRYFGIVEGAALYLQVPIYYVAPAWWKARLSVSTDKKVATRQALKRIDGLDRYVTQAQHDGIAEAALIGSIGLSPNLFAELQRLQEKRNKPKRKKVSYKL